MHAARRFACVVTLAVGVAAAAQSAAFAAAGSLDPTFGTAGTVITPVGSGDATIQGMALQSDGKIVVAGYAWDGTSDDFAVARYTTAGVLDPTFGTGGVTLTDHAGNPDRAQAVALQADGKIVAAGFSGDDFAVARYTTAGVLDPTFGTGGMVVTNVGGEAEATALAIQPNGSIVVVGWAELRGQWNFIVTRYTTAGVLDTTFHKSGQVSVDFGSNDYAMGVAIQPDGKIVVAGASGDAGTQIAVARLRSTGGLDKAFGGGTGKVITTYSGGLASWADAVALQPDGKIVVAGFVYDGTHYRFAVVRYTTAGALDTTWGGNGKVVTNLGVGEDAAHAVALQSDGKIVVAGGGGDDFGVVRYTTAGALDTTFGGGNGYVETDLGASDQAETEAIQPDGNIVLAGFSGDYTRLNFALARYTGS